MTIPAELSAKLHPKDLARLEKTLAELVELLGTELRAVLLHGEAVGDLYRPRRTRMQLIVVLERVSPLLLRRIRPRIRAWARRHVATPLMMDPLYIESSHDVFPLEFLEIADEHHLIYGEIDPFASQTLDPEHLRMEVEEQARGKMLHLWEAYLECAGRRSTMRRLLAQTPAGFVPAIRAMLYLAERPREHSSVKLVAELELTFRCELPAFTRLLDRTLPRTRPSGPELEAIFEGYLDEVRTLVRIADGLGRQAS